VFIIAKVYLLFNDKYIIKSQGLSKLGIKSVSPSANHIFVKKKKKKNLGAFTEK
jgi:hypothetical protein